MKTRVFAIITVVIMICCTVITFADDQSVSEKNGIPYIEFYADRIGWDPSEIDLTEAVSLAYSIQTCEFGYPVQTIDDEKSVRAAADYFRNIYVIGEPDGVFSTGDGKGLSLQDKEGNTIISIYIQDGMIDTSDGRCEAKGLNGIDAIPGLMTPGDWDAYYEQLQEAEEAYREDHDFHYPCSLFEAEGKEAYDFYQNCTAEDISEIYFFHNGKNKTALDPDDIQKIYDSLCQVQVTGEGEASRWMDQWSITIFYTPEGSSFQSDIRFGFREGVLSPGDEAYEVEGLEAVLESFDWDEMAVIAEMIF